MNNFFSFGLIIIFIYSCSEPVYVQKDNLSSKNPFIEKVIYEINEDLDVNKIDCIAVLPFKKNENLKNIFNDIELLPERVTRISFYSHLAPYSFKDIELNKLDYLFEKFKLNNDSAKKRISEKYNCNYFIEGQITKFSKQDVKIYSNIIIELEIKLIDFKNKNIIWKASKTQKSRDGDIPLSPLSIINGVYKSYQNTNDEKIFNLIDEISRHIIHTLPKPSYTLLDEPIINSISTDNTRNDIEYTSSLIKKENLLIELYDARPLKEINVLNLAEFYYKYGDYNKSIEILEKNFQILDKNDAAYFLKARNQIKTDKLDNSIDNLINAIRINKERANYFNLLGYAYSINEQSNKALAAYQMALDIDSENSFAHYNMAIEFYEQGLYEQSLDKLIDSGKSYAKNGKNGKLLMVLETIKSIEKHGISIDNEEIHLLQASFYSNNTL